MKHYLVSALFIYATCVGCGTQKETAQLPATEKSNAPTPQAIALQEGVAEDATVSDQKQGDLTAGTEKMTGAEIIEETTKGLKFNLSTNDEITGNISEILKNTYLETGNELNSSYEIAEARNLGKELIRSSVNRISDLLDQDQLTKLKSLIEN